MAEEKEKMYVVQCMNPECRFAFETNHPEWMHQQMQLNRRQGACQRCGNMNLRVTEKK